MHSCQVMPQSAIPRFHQTRFACAYMMLVGKFIAAIDLVSISAKMLYNILFFNTKSHFKIRGKCAITYFKFKYIARVPINSSPYSGKISLPLPSFTVFARFFLMNV